MSGQELSQFDELRAAITVFVSPVGALVVTDTPSAEKAIEAAKTIKGYLSQLEKKRTELVRPLSEQVKFINSYAKDIELPLQRAEGRIKSQLASYEAEQDKIRQAKLREEEERRREHERKIAEEQVKLEADFRAKAEVQAKEAAARVTAANEAAELFGTETVDPEAEARAIKEKTELELAERQAKAEREAKIRAAEAARKVAEIEHGRIKGAKKVWKCEAVDLEQVPRDFLIIQLNTQAVLAAARGGRTNIPGVKLWQEATVAIGTHTGVADYRKVIT